MGGNGWKWGKMTEFPSISSTFASKSTFPYTAPAGPKRRQEFKGFGRDTCGAETAWNVVFHGILWFKWNSTEFPYKIGFQWFFVNSWFLRFGTLDIPPPNHLNSCLLLRLARRGTRKPVFMGNCCFLWDFAISCGNHQISIEFVIFSDFHLLFRLCTQNTPPEPLLNQCFSRSGAPGPPKYSF